MSPTQGAGVGLPQPGLGRTNRRRARDRVFPSAILVCEDSVEDRTKRVRVAEQCLPRDV